MLKKNLISLVIYYAMSYVFLIGLDITIGERISYSIIISFTWALLNAIYVQLREIKDKLDKE